MAYAKDIVFTMDADLKEEYLNQTATNEDSRYITKCKLSSLDAYETIINKPISDWNVNNLEDFLYYCSSKNVLTLQSTFSACRTYAMYSIKHKNYGNIMPSFTIALSMIDDTAKGLKKYINMKKVADNILSHEEYLDFIDDNMCPLHLKVYFIMCYHYIKKNVIEVPDMMMSEIDFENKTVKRFNGDIVQLTDKEFGYIDKFVETQESGNDLDLDIIAQTAWRCNKSDTLHLYKQAIASYSSARDRWRTVDWRIKYYDRPCREVLKNFTNYKDKPLLNSKGIVKSGFYHDLIEQENLTLENIDSVSMYAIKQRIPDDMFLVTRDEIKDYLLITTQE